MYKNISYVATYLCKHSQQVISIISPSMDSSVFILEIALLRGTRRVRGEILYLRYNYQYLQFRGYLRIFWWELLPSSNFELNTELANKLGRA